MAITQVSSLSDEEISEMDIEATVTRVENIVETLENGEISLSEAKTLHTNAGKLLDHLETELDVGEGDIDRVTSAGE